jgi:hypothetical protein
MSVKANIARDRIDGTPSSNTTTRPIAAIMAAPKRSGEGELCDQLRARGRTDDPVFDAAGFAIET